MGSGNITDLGTKAIASIYKFANSPISQFPFYFCTLMLGIEDIQLQGLVTHYVGNGAAGDHLEISRNGVDLESPDLRQLLLQFFLTPFKETASYHLWHPADINLNEVYTFVANIFKDPETLGHQSANLARHLYDITTLPQIKSGELHVAYFTGCPINGRMTDAVGIYKTESKNRYLKLQGDKNGYEFVPDEGIDPSKMDKGCIVFNAQQDEGFLVHVIDRTSKGSEAQFWKDTFLKIKAAADNYHATEDYIKLCKEFIEVGVPAEYEVERVQQIEMMNKSVAYFKQNDQFEKESFEQQVFNDPELIQSFRRYEDQYESERDLQFNDSFDISDAAVKRNAKIMKTVLKLDKNFHVYIHGDRERIERGYDAATGMNFYKIYFEEEA